MKIRLEFIGIGARWSIVFLQLALLLNSYVVTGVTDEDSGEFIESESRSPYVYLRQREYLVQPNGDYEEVANYPETNATSSPPGTLRAYVNKLKEIQEASEEESDQEGAGSASQNFENAYTRYSYGLTDDDEKVGQESSNSPSSIQDVIKKQGAYGIPADTSSGGGYVATGAPAYDHVSYQAPLVSYEVPSGYFPSEHYEWPSTYTSSPAGPLPLSPFLGGVKQLTSSVKHLQAQLGEQKAKTAFQVADLVKNTGDAVNNAILTKGQTAGAVVAKTVQTAGEVLKSKGWTAQKIITNTGNLATSAVQSVGNIGSSLLRSKGELVGAAIKSGAAIGTSALGTISNGLAGGTYLVKAKGDAASNIISKGGWLAAGAIGTKGRLISNVINAKGQFAAQIIEAKGRAAATLLETSGQKLTQLAEAIKSVTAQKKPPTYGWSEPSEVYATPPAASPGKQEAVSQQHHQQQTAQYVPEEQPVTAHHLAQQQYSQQDYADTYYDPKDYGTRYQRSHGEKITASSAPLVTPATLVEEDVDDDTEADTDSDRDTEVFQNDYTAYYHPHHYSVRPHTDYYTKHEWE